MSTVISPEEIRPHDLLRLTIVGRADELFTEGHEAAVELLHRPKPKPKPYDGVLTGKQVKAIPWKRGTRLMVVFNSPEWTEEESVKIGDVFELNDRAIWYPEYGDGFNFQDIADDDLFVLIYRPEEESDR